MKKNLLYLWALICSVALFTACSSDDDNDISGNNPPEEEVVVTAPDVVGTYWGNLDISMKPDNSDQETVIGNGIAKFITISQVSDTEVKMELKEFELFLNGMIMKFGDIVIDKCTVKKETDASTFHRSTEFDFFGRCCRSRHLCHHSRRNSGKWSSHYEYQCKSSYIATDRKGYLFRSEAGGRIR